MKKNFIFSMVLTGVIGVTYAYAQLEDRSAKENQRSAGIENPLIDFNGFLKETKNVSEVRENRRISLNQFLKMAKEPNTIILDARSSDKYAMKHIKGAKHLSFTDFTESSLAQVISSKDTKILIYCNNNFVNNSPEFAMKYEPAALNISTFISLFTYGYKNVYELAPALDENDQRLVFDSIGKYKLSSYHEKSVSSDRVGRFSRSSR